MVLVESPNLIKEQAFAVHAKARTYGVRRGIEGYGAFLPLLNGKLVKEVIQDAVLEHNRAVNILDIGAGAGKFLSDCKNIWGDKVSSSGITAYPYEGGVAREANGNKIEIQTGDISNLAAFFQGRKFDVIVSVQTMDYLVDPWRALADAYGLLEDKATLLINEFPIRGRFVGEEGNLQKLVAGLQKEYGMHITFPFTDAGFCNIAMKKQKTDFILPVFPTGIMSKNVGGEEYSVFTYR